MLKEVSLIMYQTLVKLTNVILNAATIFLKEKIIHFAKIQLVFIDHSSLIGKATLGILL